MSDYTEMEVAAARAIFSMDDPVPEALLSAREGLAAAGVPQLVEILSLAVGVLEKVTPSGDENSDHILRETISLARAALSASSPNGRTE